jgi:anti-anti-sigma factor
MRPDFQYSCDPPLARLRIIGELDIATGDDLLDVFAYLSFRRCTIVEVDLSAIDFIDAFTLGLFRREQQRLRALGGDLLVVAASLWYALVSSVARYDTLQVASPQTTLRLLREARHLHTQED